MVGRAPYFGRWWTGACVAISLLGSAGRARGQEPPAKPAAPEPAPAAPATPAPDAAKELLAAWQKQAATLQSFTCAFTQTKRVRFMRRPLESSGTLAYKDRRLLWRTTAPTPSFLAVDAHEVRIYTPEFATLEIWPLSGAGGAGGAGGSALAGAFPGFSGDLRELEARYDVVLAPPTEGAPAGERTLVLTPREEALRRTLVRVDITLGEKLEVRRWRLVRTNGDELALTLRDFVANAKVEERDLTFEVPEGVKIVRPPGAGK